MECVLSQYRKCTALMCTQSTRLTIGSVLNQRLESAMPSTPLGDRLRQLRLSNGLKQRDLSNQAGVTIQTISRLENGEYDRVLPGTAEALARALGVSPSYLLTGYEPSKGGRSVPPEVLGVYSQLDTTTRETWVQIGHVLKEQQTRYAALQSEDGEGEEGMEEEPPEETGGPAPFKGPDTPKPIDPGTPIEIEIPDFDQEAAFEPMPQEYRQHNEEGE
jgi:transcriptional regulator with XRE-family HTH domain